MNTVGENLANPLNVGTRDPRLIVDSPSLRNFLGLCFFATAYHFAYRYGMSFSQACAAPFWFPDSVLLCALLVSRPGRWWILILASLPIRLFVAVPSDVPLWFLLAAFTIDSAKGLLAAVVLRRFLKDPIRFETLRDFTVFCLFAVLLIPATSASGGAALRHILGYSYWLAWEQWFMGNALAQLIVTPAIFYLVLGFPWKMPRPSKKRAVEGGLLIAGLILTGYVAFYTGVGGTGFAEARFYAPVPFLFWAAIRFGMLGAAGAITIIAFFSVAAALADRGPFSGQSPIDTARALQQFLLLRAAPLYLVAILVERKEGDDRLLRESEALNRGIIDSLTSLVAILDRSGRIIAVNDAWRRSYPSDSTSRPGIDIGANYVEVCRRAVQGGDSSCAEVLAALEDVLSGKEMPFKTEYSCLTPAGLLWFEILVLPLRNEAGGAVVKHRDVTDRKRAEAEAQELRDELTHADRVTMLGELSGSLAHELNQPLMAILSNAQAAQRFIARSNLDRAELGDILGDIVAADQRAGEIIRRLRLLLKKGEVQLESLDPNEVVQEVLNLVGNDLVNRSIAVQTELAPDLPAVRGDRVQLQQILLNLVTNASDAMAEQVESERRLLVCTKCHGGDGVQVSVGDSGRGIPAETLERIFDPFFTTKPQGLGLGLGVCRTILTAHGGELSAENNPAGGATFHFTLPMDRQPAK
jgi:two-component system, LuxR family, sensor kinase FixL